MGKLREKRRRNRIKKRLFQLGAGLTTTLVVLIGIFVMVDNYGPEESVSGNGAEFQFTDASTILTDSGSKNEPETVQIVMVGDMLMHERIIESGKKEDGSYNFDHLFANVKDTIESADLAIVNQETILGGPDYGYTGYPSFNSPYELGDSLVEAGFDVVLHATNHTLDKGKNAVINCMSYWEENHPEVSYLGIHQSEEDQDEIYVYEQNGIKIAILNYTYGMNGISIPSDMPYIVDMLDEDKIREDIQKAEEIADFTIVCPHWGTEYKLEADSDQKYWVNVFLEEGADLVLGTHPHVIEPIEWVEDDEGNKMLVYYSLGNFVNGTASSGSGVSDRMVGGIADVTLGRNEDGEVEIIEYGAVPIVCHIAQGTDYTVYYMEDYTQEMAAENLIISQDSEFSLKRCQSVFDEVWDDLASDTELESEAVSQE